MLSAFRGHGSVGGEGLPMNLKVLVQVIKQAEIHRKHLSELESAHT